MAAAAVNRDPDRRADIEVLEKIKLRYGDAFRGRDDWVLYPPIVDGSSDLPDRSFCAVRRMNSANGIYSLTSSYFSGCFSERPEVHGTNSGARHRRFRCSLLLSDQDIGSLDRSRVHGLHGPPNSHRTDNRV